MNHKVAAFGALAVVSAMALSACSGSGSPANSGGGGPDNGQLGNTGNGQDPKAAGPVTIGGAKKGGTVTVLTNFGLTATLDPSEVYYPDTSSIMSGLVTRSLTQYKYDPPTKNMVLVPDLATNLGTHNDNYTQWSFTIRPGVKWENGETVTAQDVAFGMTRCMDAATFPTGACQYYSNVYFKGGADYKGLYTDPELRSSRASRSTATPSPSTWPSPSRTCRTGAPFRPTDRSREGKASNPKTYKNHPLSTGPYMIKSWSARPRSSCWSRTPTGTRRPTRRARSTPTGTTSRPSSRRRRSIRSFSPTPVPVRPR